MHNCERGKGREGAEGAPGPPALSCQPGPATWCASSAFLPYSLWSMAWYMKEVVGHLQGEGRDARGPEWTLYPPEKVRASPDSGIWKTYPVCPRLYCNFWVFFSYFWQNWVLVATQAFPLVAASGGHSGCSAWASHHGGFSPCGARALGPGGCSRCSSQAVECSLSSGGARASLLCGMWDLPKSEVEPMSLTWAGRFFTIEPPGKPSTVSVNIPKLQWQFLGPQLYGLFCLKLLWVFHQLNVLAKD